MTPASSNVWKMKLSGHTSNRQYILSPTEELDTLFSTNIVIPEIAVHFCDKRDIN